MGGGLASLPGGGAGVGVAVRERRGQGAEHRFGNPHALRRIPIGIELVTTYALSFTPDDIGPWCHETDEALREGSK